jgi:hypothetical protein
MQTCTATRKNGNACSATALPDGVHCWAHAPELAEKRRDARRQGGIGRSTAVRSVRHLPADLQDAARRVWEWIDGVQGGSMKPRDAEALGSLIGRLLDLAKFSVELGQAADLEARLQALEQAAQTPHRRRA